MSGPGEAGELEGAASARRRPGGLTTFTRHSLSSLSKRRPFSRSGREVTRPGAKQGQISIFDRGRNDLKEGQICHSSIALSFDI